MKRSLIDRSNCVFSKAGGDCANLQRLPATVSNLMALLVDRIEQLVPAFDGGDDFFWISGPGEGFRVLIVFVQIPMNSDRQIDHAFESIKGFIPQILSTSSSR
jgi:hypothetical protein